MTRNHASSDGVPGPHTALYYSQRACAGLIISEATAVCKQGSGYPNIPGLWTDAQESALRDVFTAVHAQCGKMFVQLYHTGRIAHSSLTGDVPVSASAFTPKGRVTTASFTKVDYETPRALDREDFPALIQKFVAAASRAIAAGADGVEIHGANGYLIDQFLRDGTNDRTDEYGGTRVYQARLLTKITQAVASAIGLAYLHIIESFSKDFVAPRACNPISDSMKKAFVGPVILNRAYTAHSATVAIQSGAANGIAFGIPFISNPDLVRRFCEGQEKGYTDYQGALNDPNPDGLPHRARTKTPKS